MNLLTNEQLLIDLQTTVDDAEIQETAEEILEIVMTLNEGEHEQLHDIYDRPVVHVYRNAKEFRLNSVAWDISGHNVAAGFFFADYESGFESVEGFDYEALDERLQMIRARRKAEQARKQQRSLEYFQRIEKAYAQGVKQDHPYLLAKGISSDDVSLEYRVATAPLFDSRKPMDLLIYQLSENAYQVITPEKLDFNGKPQDKFNIIREPGAMKGVYAVVGDGEPEFIVEGLADAVSANMALNRPVAVGLNAGNIKHIAAVLPELILIGDNDDAGRLSAEQSGLEAIFCSDHKDIDEMRQAEGVEATKRFLERAVAIIERDREPLLGDSNFSMTLVSAPPGTGKSYHECLRVIRRTGLTVYAVHNKQAMGQDDSRFTMIRDICQGDDELTMPTIRRVNSNESEDGIASLFDRVIEEYRADDSEDKNWVVFITHKGLSMLNFELEGLYANLVIDEVPDAYRIHQQPMSVENLNEYLKFFYTDAREYSTHYVVKLSGLSPDGARFRRDESNKRNMETSSYWKLIDNVLKSRNNTKFLYIEKGIGCRVIARDGDDSKNLLVSEKPKVRICEVFDAGTFSGFSSVRMLSDDCENSLLALLLCRTQGVTLDVERISSRHEGGIASRVERIIGITDQTFSKHKLDTRPDLSNHIARAISDQCDLFNAIWLLNNSSRDNGDGITYLKEQGYEIDDLNPMTHGRNDLKRFDTVIMLYSLKPSPVESALMECLGITVEEMTRWREHNVHMQNAFRCFLRESDSSSTGTLVFPDKASIDYFLSRVEAEWGEEEREALVAKVMYLDDPQVVSEFVNKPAGRPQSGGEPLSPSQRAKLSKWRNKSGLTRLNEFAETLEEGLKGLVTLSLPAVKSLYDSWLASVTEAVGAQQLSESEYSV